MIWGRATCTNACVNDRSVTANRTSLISSARCLIKELQGQNLEDSILPPLHCKPITRKGFPLSRTKIQHFHLAGLCWHLSLKIQYNDGQKFYLNDGYVSNDRKYRRSPRTSLLPQKHDDYEPLEVGFIGVSFSDAVFNLLTTIIDVGIMALSSTLKRLGLIPGIVMTLMGVALTEMSIDMILRFCQASKTSTYSGVVAGAFGGFWRTLLQICIVINNLGMLIV